ncbi:hypothetical protein ACHAXS_005218 [Conticribra weissflogii]
MTDIETSTLGPTATSISIALKSNRSLQKEVKRRLLEVRHMQVINRQNAANVISSLSRCWDTGPQNSCSETQINGNAGKIPFDAWKELAQRKLVNERDASRESGVWQDDADEMKCTLISLKNLWKCKYDGKLRRRFFLDPDGSAPRFLGAQSVGCDGDLGAESDSFRSMPLDWEKSDVELLRRAALETSEEWSRKDEQSPGGGDNSMVESEISDNIALFEQVAQQLEFHPQRSAEECRVSYATFAAHNINRSKFTKQESLFILKIVREMGDNDGTNVDWFELASTFNKFFGNQGSGNPKTRTPWQCFRNYRSNLRHQSTIFRPWSEDEDELLLKYMAAHGPQFLFQKDAVVQMCRNLFPHFNPRKAAFRIHDTLLNPNNDDQKYSDDEERKLALLMRAYCDESRPTQNVGCVEHFPNRSVKCIAEKWNRSLNPELSFASREDERLLKNSENEETDRSRETKSKQFPHRHSHMLRKRLSLLTEINDVAACCKPHVIRNRTPKRGFIGELSDAMFSTDDFVVRKKSKKGNNIEKEAWPISGA